MQGFARFFAYGNLCPLCARARRARKFGAYGHASAEMCIMRLYKRYRTWWIAYRLRGERIRRSLHTRDESVARGILASMQLARTES